MKAINDNNYNNYVTASDRERCETCVYQKQHTHSCTETNAGTVNAQGFVWKFMRHVFIHSFLIRKDRTIPFSFVRGVNLAFLKQQTCRERQIFHYNPSIAFRHLPPRKDVVNQCWEFVIPYGKVGSRLKD